jgi:hypothetical protein
MAELYCARAISLHLLATAMIKNKKSTHNCNTPPLDTIRPPSTLSRFYFNIISEHGSISKKNDWLQEGQTSFKSWKGQEHFPITVGPILSPGKGSRRVQICTHLCLIMSTIIYLHPPIRPSWCVSSIFAYIWFQCHCMFVQPPSNHFPTDHLNRNLPAFLASRGMRTHTQWVQECLMCGHTSLNSARRRRISAAF